MKNRDVSLMAWCSILLGTIVMLSYVGSRTMFFGGGRRSNRSNGDGGGGAGVIILIISLALMILAPIFAQLIYFAISRKREYLGRRVFGPVHAKPGRPGVGARKTRPLRPPRSGNANKATAPMYIVNPFSDKNLRDLSSTHPPLQDRIRILRAMAGNASYSAYNQAYQKIRGKGSVIAPQTASLVGEYVPARPASEDHAPIEPVSEKINRTREVQDMLHNLNNYLMIDCDCGTKLKIPPGLRGQVVQCPHCGRTHQT